MGTGRELERGGPHDGWLNRGGPKVWSTKGGI